MKRGLGRVQSTLIMFLLLCLTIKVAWVTVEPMIPYAIGLAVIVVLLLMLYKFVLKG